MAAHVVNPNQLRLLLDPEEHMRTMTDSSDVWHGEESMSDMWGRKTEEAEYGDRYQGIIGGDPIERPVRVIAEGDQPLQQWEGHHRVAAAGIRQRRTGQPQYVPVTYHPDWGDAGKHEMGVW